MVLPLKVAPLQLHHLRLLAKDERNVIMARKKYQVELPNGNMVWFTGETISEAINNGLKKCGAAYFDGVQPASSLPTFKRYAEKWFPLYHVPKVKPNTANNTRIILHRRIYPALGGMRLDEITPDEIQAFFNTKMHMCRSTMQKMKIVIHQVFQSAIEDGYVQRNPASSSRLTISKRATGRTALPLTDVEDIVRQLPTLNETDRLFLLLPIYTGMRRSEMLGLRWSDVDFRLKQIRVQRGVTFAGNQPVIGPPKSKAGYRFIPLLPELDAALRAYEHEGAYIIGGDCPITEQAYQRTWERINRTINLHGATAHVFRHTFATIAAPYLDIKTLQTIMGHADIETTLDRYTHAQEERIRAAGELLTGKFKSSDS